MEKKKASHISSPNEAVTDRRSFLGKIGKAAIAATTAGAVAPMMEPAFNVAAQNRGNPGVNMRRASTCMQWRMNMAQANYNLTSNFPRINNGDEGLYYNKIGTFTKGLPHQSNGEVDLNAYYALLNAVQTESPAAFDQVPMGGDRKLTNPQSGLAFDLEGADACSFIQPPAPAFASREEAAEISENYWMAFLRDINFNEYGNNSIAAAAAADLTLFGADFKGPKDTGGNVTTNVLFRGLTAGDKAGPLMSQFWYLPCRFGANLIDQKIRTVLSPAEGGQNYMTNFNSWLSVQNGVMPPGDIFDPTHRYIRNGRDLGQWVHMDVLFQAYFQAGLIIDNMGFPVDDGNPYKNSATQMGFGTFGMPHISTLLCEVATRALKVVWNQKWFVHRRLRPEAFAGRVDRAAFHGANYPVHPEILTSVSSSNRLGGYLPAGNAFLPMSFPEGSPLHPAYGAGHATVAGACTTILKAWYNESTVLPNPVIPSDDGLELRPYSGGDTLTIGGELNKLASNVAIGRNIAGVHWRSDATESLKLGESIAISILRDQRAGYNEQFNGFSLTKFDGTTVVV